MMKLGRVQTHYGLSQKIEYLAKWSRNIAFELNQLYYDDPDFLPLFVYAGMSGVATATAVAVALTNIRKPMVSPPPFSMLYIRKRGEIAHGSNVELFTSNPNCAHTPIFVDDFINSGTTLRDAFAGLISSMIIEHGLLRTSDLKIKKFITDPVEEDITIFTILSDCANIDINGAGFDRKSMRIRVKKVLTEEYPDTIYKTTARKISYRFNKLFYEAR